MKSKAKCPKCNSKDLTIIAVWKGHIDPSDGALEPGDSYKVEGHCSSCKHHWTFRKIIQMVELESYLLSGHETEGLSYHESSVLEYGGQGHNLPTE